MSNCDKTQTLGLDGMFKELTWGGKAITRIFGFPDIVGEPIQQEYQRPKQRRVDRLYRLADDTLLNIEHQSQLHDARALGLRMADYYLLISKAHPGKPIRQAVVYAPTDYRDRASVPARIELGALDAEGHGLAFSAPVRDLREVDVSAFEESGELDHLLLGLLGSGARTVGYFERLVDRVRALRGEQHLVAVEKLAAVMAIGNTETAPDLKEQIDMWMEEVKDRPFVQRLIEVAGRDRLARERSEGAKRALAEMVFEHADEAGLGPDAGLVDLLVENADEMQLKSMVRDMEDMADVEGFLSDHGIVLPKLGM